MSKERETATGEEETCMHCGLSRGRHDESDSGILLCDLRRRRFTVGPTRASLTAKLADAEAREKRLRQALVPFASGNYLPEWQEKARAALAATEPAAERKIGRVVLNDDDRTILGEKEPQ